MACGSGGRRTKRLQSGVECIEDLRNSVGSGLDSLDNCLVYRATTGQLDTQRIWAQRTGGARDDRQGGGGIGLVEERHDGTQQFAKSSPAFCGQSSRARCAATRYGRRPSRRRRRLPGRERRRSRAGGCRGLLSATGGAYVRGWAVSAPTRAMRGGRLAMRGRAALSLVHEYLIDPSQKGVLLGY
jgi:hypothetical protein